MVLGIIALVLGALLPLFTAQAANSRISATRSHEEAIRAALITYVGRHGYLPCPADGWMVPGNPYYGHEARSGAFPASSGQTPGSLPASPCDQLTTGQTPATSVTYGATGNTAVPSVVFYRGVVPWLDLELAEDTVNDGWNQRISSLVTSLGTSGYATREAISGLLGGLVMCDSTGTSAAVLLTAIPPVGTATPIGNKPCSAPGTFTPLISTLSAAVALVSHGEDGYGAFMPPQGGATAAAAKPYSGLASPAETANIDLTTNVLVAGSYSRTFDDIVLWLTPADITGPLIQTSVIPSMQGLMSARFTQAKQAVLAALTSGSYMQQLPGGTGQPTEQLWLCQRIQDAGSDDLFNGPQGNAQNPGIANNLNPALLAPGVNVTTSWAFAYHSGGVFNGAGFGPVQSPGLAGQANYDPWGNPLIYSIGAASAFGMQVITRSNPPSTQSYAYLLYSAGPDGQIGTGDDAAMWVSPGELQAAIQTAGIPLAQTASGQTFECNP